MINVETIMNLLTKEILEIMHSDEEYYSQFTVILSNEQQFVKTADRKSGNIYIVVKFMEATLNFGQSVLPITISAVSERNKLEACQKLLLELAQAYNLTSSDDGTIKQVFTSPSVLSNFADVDFGFRSLMFMSGTFLISENSNPITSLMASAENFGEEAEAVLVNTISINANFDIQLDSQSFTTESNFTKSVGKIGTFTMNFTVYLQDDEFVNMVMAVVLKDTTSMPDGINSTFYFDLAFKNGSGFSSTPFKLANCTFQQNIGELPIMSMTFTN
jgi:hypothetical protein